MFLAAMPSESDYMDTLWLNVLLVLVGDYDTLAAQRAARLLPTFVSVCPLKKGCYMKPSNYSS